MRTTSCLCLLVMLLAGRVSAEGQDLSHFSGQWVLVDPSASNPRIATEFAVRQSVTRTTPQGAPIESPLMTLTIWAQFQSGVRTESWQVLTYSPGMSHSPNRDVVWDGHRLIFDTWRPGLKRGLDSYTETWWLDRQDRLWVSFTDGPRRSGVNPEWRTIRYRRR